MREPILDFQVAVTDDNLPTEQHVMCWLRSALKGNNSDAEITVRIVSTEESQQLNREYRGKDRPTNVLSFPSEVPEFIDSSHIGDLVICADVVKNEAAAQNKQLEAHWAHMIIHGTLHLLGYDHIQDDEADAMEALETKMILELGFSAPYEQND